MFTIPNIMLPDRFSCKSVEILLHRIPNHSVSALATVNIIEDAPVSLIQ